MHGHMMAAPNKKTSKNSKKSEDNTELSSSRQYSGYFYTNHPFIPESEFTEKVVV